MDEISKSFDAEKVLVLFGLACVALVAGRIFYPTISGMASGFDKGLSSNDTDTGGDSGIAPVITGGYIMTSSPTSTVTSVETSGPPSSSSTTTTSAGQTIQENIPGSSPTTQMTTTTGHFVGSGGNSGGNGQAPADAQMPVGNSPPASFSLWDQKMRSLGTGAQISSKGSGKFDMTLEKDGAEVTFEDFDGNDPDWNNAISITNDLDPSVLRNALPSNTAIRDYVWVDTNNFVAQGKYKARLTLPSTYRYVYRCEGDKANPVCVPMKRCGVRPCYMTEGGKTVLLMDHFSGGAGLDPTRQFNQSGTGVMNGNSSSIDPTVIDPMLDINADSNTWNITERSYRSNTITSLANSSDNLQMAGVTQKELVRLSFTPTANSKWLVMGYTECNNSDIRNQTTVRINRANAAQFLSQNRPRVANTEWMPYMTAHIYTGAGTVQIYNITVQSSSTSNASCVRSRLFAMRLDNLVNNDTNSSLNTATISNVNNVWSDAAGDADNVTIKPKTDGVYLIWASAVVDSDATNSGVAVRLDIDNGVDTVPYLAGAESTWSYARVTDNNTNEDTSFALIHLAYLNSSVKHNISLQVADVDATASADWMYRSIVVIRLSDVYDFINASKVTEESTVSNTFVNYTVDNIPVGNAGNWLALGNINLRGSSNASSFEQKFVLDGVNIANETERPQTIYDYLPRATFYNFTIDDNAHYLATQYRNQVGAGTTAYVKNSDIVALSLFGRNTYDSDFRYNGTISYDGTLYTINVSVNLTTDSPTTINSFIYNYNKSAWNSTPCQNVTLTPGIFTTLWCNVTDNPQWYFNASRNVSIWLSSIDHFDEQSNISVDYVQYYVSYIVGYLEVNLTIPITSVNVNVVKNYTFTINATVYCRGGPCGNVNGTVLYNLSSATPDTPFNLTAGDEPFYLNGSSPSAMKSCPTNPLIQDEWCNITWTANVTGDSGTDWEIGAMFNSSFVDITDNSTLNATVSILPCMVNFQSRFSNLDFGKLSPNTYNKSATNNNVNKSNITIQLYSCPIDLYVRGVNMVNNTFGDSINVANISFSNISNRTIDGAFRMSTSNQLLYKNARPVRNVTSWFWLDVPPTRNMTYYGNISITGVNSGDPVP